eukprot:GEMP01061930.1.p1 GENE.GEMP01061930.1~~GEMP01061930.1.p1  ORF type:complete len:230 (+),score=36.98 GEMP01061930.1:31-720(+)
MGCGRSNPQATNSRNKAPKEELVPYSDEWYAVFANLETILANFGEAKVREAFFDGPSKPSKQETLQSQTSLAAATDILRLEKDTAPMQNTGLQKGTLFEHDRAPARRIQALGSQQRRSMGEHDGYVGYRTSMPEKRLKAKSFQVPMASEDDFFETTVAWRTAHLLKKASSENPGILCNKRLASSSVVPLVVSTDQLSRAYPATARGMFREASPPPPTRKEIAFQPSYTK